MFPLGHEISIQASLFYWLLFFMIQHLVRMSAMILGSQWMDGVLETGFCWEVLCPSTVMMALWRPRVLSPSRASCKMEMWSGALLSLAAKVSLWPSPSERQQTDSVTFPGYLNQEKRLKCENSFFQDGTWMSKTRALVDMGPSGRCEKEYFLVPPSLGSCGYWCSEVPLACRPLVSL